jgi:AAA+ superfamily predicted ATPase
MSAPAPHVVAALERAVVAAPGDASLRSHLCRLLLDAGRPEDALAQVAVLLAARPDDPEALSMGEAAAVAAGDPERAAAYGRLRVALTGAASAPQAPAASDPAAPPAAPPPAAEPAPERQAVPLRVIDGVGDEDDSLPAEVERPRLTLADVGGMEAVKKRLEMAFLAPMRNPQLRQMYGKSLRGGLLLWGPPGCGKTFVARATAGELAAKFIGVGLSDVLDMWVGLSERNLHGIFEMARRHAPCVLFIDELDALGQKRLNTRSAPTLRNVIAQLLTELDGAMTDNEGVFVLGATNAPWDIDAALKRPGRFDRALLVLPPDLSARQAILRHHLQDRPLGTDLDLAAIAARTDGFSGADLAHVCESAAEYALSDAIRSGNARPIGQADLLRALGDVRSSLGEWFAMARNFAMFQNESGGFDDLLEYLRAHRLA